MNSILEIKNVSKVYKNYNNEIWRLLSWFGIVHKPTKEIRILQNIDFSLFKGESLGIIGQNGAGKSTLLKIITGTLKPTTGRVTTDGKIAAILELGMGFHPDLTGRENTYHSAGLMGYTSEEIDAVINDIETFAEIGEYFDQPVRTHSSGMQMRVAFAVATAFRPDVLIIDEALSVGDAYFQHKCFDRIKSFAEKGTSLLFVSHDAAAIKNICTRAILIKNGMIIYEDTPENVLDFYNADYGDNEILKSSMITGTRSGNKQLVIGSVTLLNNLKASKIFSPLSSMDIEVIIDVIKPIGKFTVGLAIKDRVGNVMIGTNTELLKKCINATKEGEKIVVQFIIPSLHIGEGIYSVSIALHDPASHVISNYDWWDRAAMFEIQKTQDEMFTGLCYFPVELKIIKNN